MAPTTKSLNKFLVENKTVSKTKEDLQKFRDLNPEIFMDRDSTIKNIKIPTKSGSRIVNTNTNGALSFIIAEYQRKPKKYLKDIAILAMGRRLQQNTEEGRALANSFVKTFGNLEDIIETMEPLETVNPLPLEDIQLMEEEPLKETLETVNPLPLEDTMKEEPLKEPLETLPLVKAPKVLTKEIVDEPRPNGSLNFIKKIAKIDFSKDTVEDRLDQIEAVFDSVEEIHEVPENIKQSSKEGLKIIRSSIKESKKSVFQKIKSIAKTVLGFISLAPLPIPAEIKLGAGIILTGIEAIEQTVGLFTGETEETDIIRAGIDLVSNVEELAPIAEAADGIVSVIEGIIEVKNAFVEGQDNKDSSKSVPIPDELLNDNIEVVLQEEQSKIDTATKEGEFKSIQDPNALTLKTPLQLGEDTIQIDVAKQLATEKDNPEEEIKEEEIKQEENQPPVLKGNKQIEGLYENAIHPDAIGIYFGSSTNPKWDKSLLSDRNTRFSSISPEETKPFLLQQNRMIYEKYSIDLLIPKLVYDETSDPVDIQRENFEIIQLWSKLKGVSKTQSDKVGIKLGDLMNFRSLLTDENKSSVNPLSPVEPQDPQAVQQTDQQTNQPQVQKEVDVKDTTKNFVYSPSGIRISKVVSDKEARKSARPSLSEMVTLSGAKQLQTRSNLTRGWRHGGPVLNGIKMNEIRRAFVGTRNIEEEKKKTALYVDLNTPNAKVRI